VASVWFFILQLSQWCTVQQTSNTMFDIYIYIYIPSTLKESVRGEQIPSARSLRRLNFVRWLILFVGPPKILRLLLNFWKIFAPLESVICNYLGLNLSLCYTIQMSVMNLRQTYLHFAERTAGVTYKHCNHVSRLSVFCG